MSFNEKLIMGQKELNIAEILKYKPKGTKLWSPAYGQCELQGVALAAARPIDIEVIDDTYYSLSKDARICKGGEPMLFPSKEMRDWEKFTWKKGDVLTDYSGDISCIFVGWCDDEYETFTAKFIYSLKKWHVTSWFYTCKFLKSPDSEAFINMIEEQYGGKLNLSTLEIEKKPEFKNGDILTFIGYIFIFKNIDDSMVYSHASYDTDDKYCIGLNADIPFASNIFIKDFKYTTKEEKQRLFDALAKKGKAWDAEKKQIVDLPKEEKKCEFKPMDWCLMKVCHSRWNLCQYAYYREDTDMFVAIGGKAWKECIPYNEETKHLLGTTDDWEGGEK